MTTATSNEAVAAFEISRRTKVHQIGEVQVPARGGDLTIREDRIRVLLGPSASENPRCSKSFGRPDMLINTVLVAEEKAWRQQ